MNKKDINDLSKLLVELGKKRHGLDCAYPFALGTIVGLVDSYIKYRPHELQDAIDIRYAEAEKELAAA